MVARNGGPGGGWGATCPIRLKIAIVFMNGLITLYCFYLFLFFSLKYMYYIYSCNYDNKMILT